MSCEFAIVIADDWQHRGIARRLMAALVEGAALIAIIVAYILPSAA